ncbi:M20/M25/M40 family metallo-hydrolase [Roseovarius sp. D22-M7]|uniref:M20/M25/M40 family metallo-hydrolase n=1 Tax=Roseovarius sp. D22-M7 TaxID=3127116 RepID=UPI00300F853B
MPQDPMTLPFDADEMLEGLRPWIETESPTFDAAAVNRMMDVVQHDLAALGARVERIPGRMGLGDSVRATLPHPRAGEGGILLLGHMDTVHPVGTLETLPFRRDGNLCYGPGLMDMKGGNYVYLDALRKLLAAGIETPLPVTVLFTPDEEIGTPSARGLIEAEAQRHKFILIPEPACPDGSAVIGRYAIARFNLCTLGTPSHASWALSEGRSAIAEMARKVAEIEGFTTEDCSFSVGVIRGGQWVNCVSSRCDAEVLSMAKSQDLLDDGVQRMLDLNSDEGAVRLEVRRGVTRPLWQEGQPGTMAMLDVARGIASEIGFELAACSAGGGSDGNFTGALGLATLDSIGVRGKGLHTLDEHIEIDSLLERARLAAGLFCRLGV